MRLMILFPLILILVGCSRKDEESPARKACIADLYSAYDPKNVDQCMNVCIKCDSGVITTCSTSCRLKGAR
jgi:hypothetical protein